MEYNISSATIITSPLSYENKTGPVKSVINHSKTPIFASFCMGSADVKISALVPDPANKDKSLLKDFLPIICGMDRRLKVTTIAFHPEKDILAIGYGNGNLYLVNILVHKVPLQSGEFFQTEHCVLRCEISSVQFVENKHQYAITHMTFNSNGSVLATASIDKACIWTLLDESLPTCINTWRAYQGSASLDLSDDGQILVIGEQDGYLRICHTFQSQQSPPHTRWDMVRVGSEPVTSVALCRGPDPSNNWVLIACSSEMMNIFNVSVDKSPGKCGFSAIFLTSLEICNKNMRFHLIVDKRMCSLVTAVPDSNTIHLWKLNFDRSVEITRVSTLPYQGKITSIGIDLGKNNIIVGTDRDKIELLPIPVERRIRGYDREFDTGRTISCIKSHPSLPLFAVGSNTGLLTLSENNGTFIESVKIDPAVLSGSVNPDCSGISCLKFYDIPSDRNNVFVLCGLNGGTVVCYSFPLDKSHPPKLMFVLNGHTKCITEIAINMFSKIATCSTDNTFRLWDVSRDLTTVLCLYVYNGEKCNTEHASLLSSFDESKPTPVIQGTLHFCDLLDRSRGPDAILSVEFYGPFHESLVYSTQNFGTKRMSLSPSTTTPHHVITDRIAKMHPTGKFFASIVGNDVVLCNKDGTILLNGHTGPVTSLTFHQTKPLLVTASSADKTIKIWDMTTGNCTTTICSKKRVQVALFANDDDIMFFEKDGNKVKIVETR